MNNYERRADSDLIRNKKFFVPPQEDDLDLKALLRLLVAAGAGRPVDRQGMPQGPWTAELLAEAISALDDNGEGVDLRTVQHWLQDNDRGIRAENIRWLARVFGCGDPEATSQWQRELSLAQDRLVRNRRTKQSALPVGPVPADSAENINHTLPAHEAPQPDRKKPGGFNLARLSEALFSSQSPLMLPSLVWAGWIILGFLAYIFGLHDITYRATGSVEKQVGFFWAPNWTILELVILPLFLTLVVSILAYWKKQRLFLTGLDVEIDANYDWHEQIDGFRPLCWIAFCLCFFVVFALQWSGIHLRAFVTGTVGDLMVDWNLITLIQPGTVTVAQVAILSGLAFFYTACICFLFLTGLILMLAILQDFASVLGRADNREINEQRDTISALHSDLLRRVFKATLLGIWIATCIKIQAVYLSSDAPNILAWIAQDASRSFSLDFNPVNQLGQRALAHFTSFLLLSATVLVFVIALVSVDRSEKRIAACSYRSLGPNPTTHWSMPIVILLLVGNFFFVGQFAGFSILLLASLLVSAVILVSFSFQKTDGSMKISNGWIP